MMAAAEVFRALGDPVRLEMMQRLASGEPRTISAVSSDLGISRQGARKHLQVLADAKLIWFEPKGRDVQVLLDRESLDEAKRYIADLERRWDKRLEALRRFVEEDSHPG
jgi:DNA-binding transcriptional ArsR family regulator